MRVVGGDIEGVRVIELHDDDERVMGAVIVPEGTEWHAVWFMDGFRARSKFAPKEEGYRGITWDIPFREPEKHEVALDEDPPA